MSILCIYTIDVITLICNWYVVAKTLCKNSPKNPQKSGKNLVAKNPAKTFVDHFKKILTKKL